VGTFFLDLFCGGIVSCSSAETMVDANVGGSEKSEGGPKHKNYEVKCAIYERQGDKESPKVRTHLKSCEPLYTCPRAPFYRETKGLLHFENTLEYKEYS
jgi:hypothetical protein